MGIQQPSIPYNSPRKNATLLLVKNQIGNNKIFWLFNTVTFWLLVECLMKSKNMIVWMWDNLYFKTEPNNTIQLYHYDKLNDIASENIHLKSIQSCKWSMSHSETIIFIFFFQNTCDMHFSLTQQDVCFSCYMIILHIIPCKFWKSLNINV